MAVVLSNAQQLEIKRKEKEREDAKQAELEKQMFSMPALVEMSGYNEQMLTVLQKTVAKGTTPAEFAYFLTVAKSSGLNPINKEVWCYKDHKDNVIIFTGRDGFLKRNKDMQSFLGMRSSEVCEYDEFEMDIIEGTVKHKITNNRGKVIGAYAIVEHEGKIPVVTYLDFDEFNLGQAKWKTAPKMMIKKCAQSHALKEAAGMTGIQAEESWSIKDNIASSNVEQKTEDVNHEEIRLEELIRNAKTPDELKKHLKHCENPALIELYEMRMNELQNN